MSGKDIFYKIRDYVDAQNILDELDKFLSDEELIEFCDFLKDEYDLDMSDDEYYDDEDY